MKDNKISKKVLNIKCNGNVCKICEEQVGNMKWRYSREKIEVESDQRLGG